MNPSLQSVQLVASLTINMAVTARRAAPMPPQIGAPDSEFITSQFTVLQPGYDENAPVRQQHRVSLEPGLFWRQEIMFQNNTGLSVIFTPTSAAIYSAAMGLMTTEPRFRWQASGQVSPTKVRELEEGFPIFPPQFHASEWAADTDAAELLGRAATRVRVRRRAAVTPSTPALETTETMWSGFDEYEYVCDREYGLVLEYSSFDAGERAAHLKLEELSVNQPIPARARELSRRWGKKRTFGVNIG